MFRILRNSAARLWRATGTSVTIDAHRHAAGLAEEIAQGADVLESASHGDPRIGKRGLLQKPLDLRQFFRANDPGDRTKARLRKPQVEKTARNADRISDIVHADAFAGMVVGISGLQPAKV